jgi:uncharacterized protein (DUF2252 family)
MTHRITRDIIAHNAGRDPARLQLKFKYLRESPFAFFRGTNHLFLKQLPRSHPLFRAPGALICGDLHLENFGTYKGDNRLCYFDINDFDEACLAPFTVEIVRFLTGLYLAAPDLNLKRSDASILARSFLHGYQSAIESGKPRWLERSIADGAIRVLLRRVIRRTRTSLLDRYSRVRRQRRAFRIDDVRMFAANSAERKALAKFCSRLKVDGLKKSFFHMLDAARRVAGNGSLGIPRFMLLVSGRGSPASNFLLDLKFADRSATADWARLEQPKWKNEAQRIVVLQRIIQAIPPALLSAARFDGRHFVLKELQPLLDRLDLADLSAKIRRLNRVVGTMGSITAWAHLRGCGRLGAVPVDDLQSYVENSRWHAQAAALARASAESLNKAWMAYRADYDAGRVIDKPAS